MFVICFDTICEGYQPIRTGDGGDKDSPPLRYVTEDEAQAELDSDPEFYRDCFVCPESDIGHKSIYYGHA